MWVSLWYVGVYAAALISVTNTHMLGNINNGIMSCGTFLVEPIKNTGDILSQYGTYNTVNDTSILKEEVIIEYIHCYDTVELISC